MASNGIDSNVHCDWFTCCICSQIWFEGIVHPIINISIILYSPSYHILRNVFFHTMEVNGLQYFWFPVFFKIFYFTSCLSFLGIVQKIADWTFLWTTPLCSTKHRKSYKFTKSKQWVNNFLGFTLYNLRVMKINKLGLRFKMKGQEWD